MPRARRCAEPILRTAPLVGLLATVLGSAWSLSRVRHLSTPWTAARQASLSMGILQARILEWVAMPGDLPDPGIEPESPALQADSSPSEPIEKPTDY